MNHTAERNMRTIGEMTTTTMIHANLPKRTWGYATMLAIDVINRTADSVQPSLKNRMSRLERWKGKELPGQTKALYPFGCLAFKHVPPALRTKLDAHASPQVYLGIDPKSHAYLLGSIYDLRLSVSVEATFLEHEFPFRKVQLQDSPAKLLWGTEAVQPEGDSRLGMFENQTPLPEPQLKPVELRTLKAIYGSSQASLTPKTTAQPTAGEVKDPFPNDSLASLPPISFDAHEHSMVILSESMMQTETPRYAHQAVFGTRAAQWIAAMNREKSCHLKNGTFGEEWHDTGSKPPKVTPADWVFRIKHRGPPIDDSQLLPNQFKARVVIKGQFMKEGIDFNDTFAPVAKHVTLRALFAVATKYGCKLIAGDVETAFLSSPIDCEIWIRMPPFWGKDTDPITNQQCDRPPRRLLKGVPGIPQGSRLFYTTMAQELKLMNFVSSTADHCLFVPTTATATSERVAVLLWVDDFVMMYEQEQTATSFLARLRQRFNIPTVGPLAHFLGMDIQYKPESRQMFLCQEHTTDVLLERARLQDCNPAQTPCPAGTVFSKQDCPSPASPRTTEYASLIALANYLACWTCPDIAYIVNKLCKFMANPGEVHWQLLKHLLRYLKGTKHKGLLFDFANPSSVTELHGYCDSSHADCPDTRHSTLAYVFRLDNAVLSWHSKLHSYVTSCTNHSEYAALFAAAKEAQWLVYLFKDLKLANMLPIPIYVDSSGVVSMVFNPVDHKSNKHVEIAHHYSRELTELRVITPQRLPSADNIADVLTKPLAAPAFLAVVPKLVNIFLVAPQVGKPSEERKAFSEGHIEYKVNELRPPSQHILDLEPEPQGTSPFVEGDHLYDSLYEEYAADQLKEGYLPLTREQWDARYHAARATYGG